jgi:hypothetical protein
VLLATSSRELPGGRALLAPPAGPCCKKRSVSLALTDHPSPSRPSAVFISIATRPAGYKSKQARVRFLSLHHLLLPCLTHY